jgi:hypothetical protein
MAVRVPVAQRIEQQPSKLLMGVRFPPGTPLRRSFIVQHPPLAQLVELLPLKEKVVGSNPTGRTENQKPPRRGFWFESLLDDLDLDRPTTQRKRLTLIGEPDINVLLVA